MSGRGPAIALLRLLSVALPGDRLKTAAYRAFVARPRKVLRMAVTAFYRYDHVYEVLESFRRQSGPGSVLEFGTSEGYSFVKLLYAVRHLGLEDRVTVHGFDSFEGLPPARDARDQNVVRAGERWVQGQFKADYQALHDYCAARSYNFRLHRGYFEATLTPELIAELREAPPILVWIDCDYYSSARAVMERVLPVLPSGCVLYFDDFDLNYGSRLTGEARLVHEMNHGAFGDDLELVLDTDLSWNSRRIYRFVRLDGSDVTATHAGSADPPPPHRPRGNGSPLP